MKLLCIWLSFFINVLALEGEFLWGHMSCCAKTQVMTEKPLGDRVTWEEDASFNGEVGPHQL